LGSWVLVFPWGSIISGSRRSSSSLDVCRLTLTLCRLTVTFFIFLLRCAVTDFMIVLHLVVIIMSAVAFYMIVLLPVVLCFAG